MDTWHAKTLKAATTVKEANALTSSDVAHHTKVCAGSLDNSADCKQALAWVTADKKHLSAVNSKASASTKATSHIVTTGNRTNGMPSFHESKLLAAKLLIASKKAAEVSAASET